MKQIQNKNIYSVCRPAYTTGAFTLVELIVVITILAILGTIAFISLQGYSAQARDSKRLSDIQNIKKSLELFSLNTGKFPVPDNSEEITYGVEGDVVWNQGTVGEVVSTNLSRNLNKKPVDPLTETEYTYSTIVSQTQYELLSIYESDIVSDIFLLKSTNAENQDYPRVDGNYNGLFVKTENYYVASPSIITSEDTSGGLELTSETIKSQIITGGSNIISQGFKVDTLTGQLEINLSAYTGSITSSNIETEGVNFIEAIQRAYSGTVLENKLIYQDLLSINTSDSGEVTNYVETVVFNNENYGMTTINSNCGVGTTYGVTYTTVNYEYGEIIHGETGTGTATVNDGGIINYIATITCNDGEISISNEQQEIESFYSFTSHTFTNCGKTGRYGPTLTECRSSYSTDWDENNNFYTQGVKQGYQLWTVPETGTYRIQTAGAEGGYSENGGSRKGASIRGDFELNVGDKLLIVVGQEGQDRGGDYDAGSGGGTFVALGDDITTAVALIVSGGGAGTSSDRDANPASATTTPTGIGAVRGIGQGGGDSSGPGGGGFLSDGINYCNDAGGNGFRNNLIGGQGNHTRGGFGGGSGGCDEHGTAGGGYTGGTGRDDGAGSGGGGSYNNGTNQVNLGGNNSGMGYVTITKL